MSETKIFIPDETVRQLKFISKNINKFNVSSENKQKGELWLSSQGSGGYDWNQLDIGVNNKSELIFCFQSGCSCNGPESPTSDTAYALVKGMSFEQSSYDDPYDANELIETTNIIYRVLKKKNVDVSKVISLPNAEIRRAVIELIGMEKFISGANTKILDENETHGQLLMVELQDDENLVLLHVKDPSTDREYFLRVPPDMKTAAQARAWTFGFNSEDFVLEKET